MVCILVRKLVNPYPVVYRSPNEEKFYDPLSKKSVKFDSLEDTYSVNLSVVVPAYNEAERLPPMLDECLTYLENQVSASSNFSYEVIIVSDGSRDNTVKIGLKYVEQYGSDKVRVLELEKNRGKGGAVTLGIQSCRGAVILFADADGATKFHDISKLELALELLIHHNYKAEPEIVSQSLALICGSRAHLEEEAIANRSFFRNILMHGFHFLVWLFAVRTIRDTQCGFKLLTRKTAMLCFKSLHVQRWAFDVELLYIAERLKIPMSEVSVRWTEIEGSKLVPVWSWLQMGRDLCFIWFRYRIGAWKLKESGKGGESSSSPLGYHFKVSTEELGEIQLETNVPSCSTPETKPRSTLTTTGSLDTPKNEEDKNELFGETVREYWGLLGRSPSVDSNYQSPFSNPSETWRKLNELKGKITKTVEKISEMKNERSASSPTKLFSSKENSSMSDSEDTSESSKTLEQWKDAEDINSSLKEVINKTTDMLATTLDTALQNAKSEIEAETTLRNRKSCSKLSEVNIPNIKIATASTSTKESFIDESVTEDVESGVEADENLNSISFDAFDENSIRTSNGGSQTPPGGFDIFWSFINYCMAMKSTEVYTVLLLVALVIYYFLPLTDFFQVKSYFFRDDPFCSQGPFVIPDYRSMPPLKVPVHKPVGGVWINEYEYESYDPDYYSVTQTVPAYLELDNAILKLSRPKGKINKRATFDEPEYKLIFSSQRAYNISGCNVFLMPEGLTRKRLFSKKYPIVIFLKSDSFIGERNTEEKEHHEGLENDDFQLKSSPSSEKKSRLFLFARCDRQKEEWYRKLLTATRVSSTQDQTEEVKFPEEDIQGEKKNAKDQTTPFENIFFDSELAQANEYLQYMAKFVDLSQSNGLPQLPLREDADVEDTKFPSLQVQWFNAFLNRILFDMFRSPYWLAKIHEKVYKKLNSIRLPYYIEEIEVIEMDLGKTGPTFHRVSQPYIDERGLWFDMDTTFDGMIKLTIQTHLNLIKLQKGMEEEQAIGNALAKTEKEKKKHKELKDPFLVKEIWLDEVVCNSLAEQWGVKTLAKPARGMIIIRAMILCTEATCSKDRNGKSKETVNRTNKKLEKRVPRKSISSEESAEGSLHAEVGKSDAKFEKSSMKINPATLYDEVARLAEIAIEEENEDEDFVISRSPIYDSEVEDSAESSEEEIEDEEEVSPVHAPPDVEEPTPISVPRRYPKNRRSSKKLFRMFENVAQSKYFKSVAQSKYVQKAIAGVSATKLKLTLEVKSCSGILTVNIPPPPSDRFWYGFRDMPKLIFSANPKIGEKTVRFAQIKNYLQKKILHEIKKAMVVPNLIDFVLPTSEPGRSSSSQQIEESVATNPDDQEATSSE
ncbi:hypothetical protein RUM43_004578 [Polyplax serrata]|uniref:Dolichyl-phosphate beta-glucosyltransferase n=1 Tax=Polyplax serrata TaxID=468196 RepID=A0AAN8XM45_POLSC